MKQHTSIRGILIFVSIFCFSLTSVSAASAPFADVKSDSPYLDALVYLKDKGVVAGYDDGTFQPTRQVNRAEALKMLLTGLGIQIFPQKSSFPDVASGAWYAPYVSQALKNGYVKGYPDGLFRPEQNVNRVEALKMLLEISQAMKNMASTQQNAIELDPSLWYAKYVLFASNKNIVDVFDESQIHPGEAVTRGDIAEMLYRYMYLKENNLTVFKNYEEGNITYYADELQGNATSSGEKYDRDSFTAAHRTLAFGTYTQVVDARHEKSAIVRINDRGPFTASLLIDLSAKAFGALAPLSQGKLSGEVYRVGNGDMNKKYISPTTFPAIELASPLPNMMQVGEFYVLSGVIKSPSAANGTFMLSDGHGMSQEYTPVTQNSSFETALYFPTAGTYTLSFGGISQVIYVTDTLFSKPVKTLAGVTGNLGVTYDSKNLRLDWTASQNANVYLLKFTQGKISRTLLVNNSTHLTIQPQNLNGLSEGSWSIDLYAGYTSTGFSHDRMTTWQKIASTSATFMTDFNPVFLANNLQMDDREGEIVTPGEQLEFKGKAIVDLKNEFFILTSDGELTKEKLVPDASEVIVGGTYFSFTYKVPRAGSYIFEVIRPDGKPVYLSRYRTQDVFLLSREFVRINSTDLSNENAVKATMLEWINEDRARSGLPTLVEDGVLDNISKTRAQDLVDRNYFSHYDPDGKSINDVKFAFNFYPSIAENLAYSSESVLAAYLELRHSPSHLENILKSDVHLVGLGFAKKDDIVYVVQAFSAKPLSAYSVTDLRDQWVIKANAAGKGLHLSDTLTPIAQEWAESIADAHVLTFKLHGKSLLEEFLNRGGDGSYVANVVSSDSLDGVEKKVIDILSRGMPGADVGIGIAQDTTGPIKVVIGVRE